MHWTDYEGTGARYLTIDRMPREDRLRILNGSIVNRASYLPVRLQPPRHHHPRAARHQRPGSRLQPDARRLELRQAALTNRRRGLRSGTSRPRSTGRPCSTRVGRSPSRSIRGGCGSLAAKLVGAGGGVLGGCSGTSARIHGRRSASGHQWDRFARTRPARMLTPVSSGRGVSAQIAVPATHRTESRHEVSH